MYVGRSSHSSGRGRGSSSTNALPGRGRQTQRYPFSSSGEGTSSSRFGHTEAPTYDSPPTDLGALIGTLKADKLDGESKNSITIRHFSHAASYNWLSSSSQPTIAIPGVPPKWSPPVTTPQLREDSGTYYRDLNAAMFPNFPMQPAVEAVLANDPQLDTGKIDICTCASSMAHLIRYISGSPKPFRISLEAVGNTVFFIRRERSPTEVIPNVRGYGHTMPEAYTTWDQAVKGSESHQRIVKYKLGKFWCLVRYEADGYFEDKLESSNRPEHIADPSQQVTGTEFDLSEALQGTAVSFAPPNSSEALTSTKSGFEVPPTAIFDLKTRTAKRKGEDFIDEFSPRLWLTQIPTFIVAYHSYGRFNEIDIKDVRNDIKNWETNNQQTLAKLHNLLKSIISMVRNKDDEMLEIWRPEQGNLEVRRIGDNFRGALPPDLEDRWRD